MSKHYQGNLFSLARCFDRVILKKVLKGLYMNNRITNHRKSSCHPFNKCCEEWEIRIVRCLIFCNHLHACILRLLPMEGRMSIFNPLNSYEFAMFFDIS